MIFLSGEKSNQSSAGKILVSDAIYKSGTAFRRYGDVATASNTSISISELGIDPSKIICFMNTVNIMCYYGGSGIGSIVGYFEYLNSRPNDYSSSSIMIRPYYNECYITPPIDTIPNIAIYLNNDGYADVYYRLVCLYYE